MENRSVEVSVIIPNYNYARFLRERIESILAQTFTDYELILLDDASTDESVSLLETYRHHPRVSQLVVNVQNTGSPFAQWRKGVSLASGRYIWIAESDDAAEPTFLARAVEALHQHPDASFCFLGSRCMDEHSQLLRTDFDHWTSRQLNRSSQTGVFDGMAYIEHNLYWRNYIYNASGAVFRKSCFEQVGDNPCFAMRYCGDWLFWIEMARQGQVIEIYEKLNRFRLHGTSTTKQAKKKGEGVKEDMQIVALTEKLLPQLSTGKKRIRHGCFYKNIRRLDVPDTVRRELLAMYREELQGTCSDYYWERFCKWFAPLLPGVVTRDSDRL